MNNHQQLTCGIKHWGLSGYLSILPRIKFNVTGKVSSPQSPTISYRHPLPTPFQQLNQFNINVTISNTDFILYLSHHLQPTYLK